MKSSSVIIIGAGIGGIATAAHLARQGIKVTVFEKNPRPGGRFDAFTRQGHHFDTGPTLLVMPLLYEAEFAELGVSLHDMLDLQRVDPTYHPLFCGASTHPGTGVPTALVSARLVARRVMEALQ